MILFGASGHAKVIVDVLEKSGTPPDHLIDANPDVKALLSYTVKQDNGGDYAGETVLISIGANHIRAKIANRLRSDFFKAIHPTAVIDKTAKIGEGTVVMAGTVVNSSTLIGKHVIINTGSSVDHDCIVGDYAHISPGAVLCGGVSVKEGTQIGAGATVIPNISIGKWVTVGAGSVIINDIPDGAIVVGNPGRIIKIKNEY